MSDWERAVIHWGVGSGRTLCGRHAGGCRLAGTAGREAVTCKSCRAKLQSREDNSGRFTFDGDLDRLCVCGHTLGHHAGGSPHECFVGTLSRSDPNRAECNCPKFRPSRKKTK